MILPSDAALQEAPAGSDAAAGGRKARSEALEQIAYADRVVLNKTDLVEPAEVVALEERISRVNSMARIESTRHGDVDVDFLLGVGGFDLNSIRRSLNALQQEQKAASRGRGLRHDHIKCDHDHGRCVHGSDQSPISLHSDAVTSVSLTQSGDLNLGKVMLLMLLMISAPSLYSLQQIHETAVAVV